jgi:hypothetical protein
VDEVLAPHVAMAPAGIVPLLALDSYQCHMMASVVNCIQDLGVEVEHIPGGCTGLCQPLDVGINKHLKCHIRQMWNEWMVEEGIMDGNAVPPTRELIVQWTIDSWWKLTTENIKKAWRHGEFSTPLVCPLDTPIYCTSRMYDLY